MIDYYIRASLFLLPHLKNRPVTLKRYPDGVRGQFFYEKDAPRFTPEWVKTFPVPRRTGKSDIRYVLINDLPTLVWAANIASLEFHPFLHRVPNLDRPTSVVFDLDPGQGFDILACAQVAFLLKEALAHIHLDCFAKVSGSKGIQVYAPLNTSVQYSVTQSFARALAEHLAKEHPNLIVSEMAKSKRIKKVFIDWSQNSDFKTTVAVYSLRAKRNRPFVSIPVTWDELHEALRSRQPNRLCFEPEAALNRLEEIGDLFAPVLNLKQRLSKSILSNLPAGDTPAVREKPHNPRNTRRLANVDLDKLPQSPMNFVEPMQCKLVAALPQGDQWQYEVKLDGYRAIAIKDQAKAQLLSRRNNSLNRKFPVIADALGKLEEGIILDGEIVALDAGGRPSFNALQHYESTRQPIVFYAFDILAYHGRDLQAIPLQKRRELLNAILDNAHDPIRISTVLHASASDVVDAVSQQGLEGVIGKRAGSRYEPGERSGAWVKYKVNRGQELVIGGYKPGKNYFENLAVGYYDHDRLMFVAKIKNGFTPASRREVFKRFEGLETDVRPFANLPEPKTARRGEALTRGAMKKYKWLRPELVAQIEFTEWTRTNHLRHASFATLRDDKDPRQVVHEIPERV